MVTQKEYKFTDILGNLDFFINKTIEVTSISEYDETYFTEGLRGRIIEFTKHDWSDEDEAHLGIIMDFSEHEEFNFPRMERVFYGKDNELKKWHELESYKLKKGIDTLFVMKNPKTHTDRDSDNRFILCDAGIEKLHEAFKKPDESNYVTFLEKSAIKAI